MRTERLDPTRPGGDGYDLRRELQKKIIGQDQAIDDIVEVWQIFKAGMNTPGHPIGNFLFLGPTGTGKTRIVESLAETLVRDDRGMIKIDCAEFQHSHEIAKLIGSPPGYLGHRETHPALSQEILNLYHTEKCKVSFVLFDEIEKASDALWNLLLGILDKATLTLGDNRRVDFTNTMIFLTSNLGSSEMGSMLKPPIGFSKPLEITDLQARFGKVGLEAAQKKFKPEFINRLDKITVFNYLSSEHLDKILDIELELLKQRILNSTVGAVFTIAIHPEVKKKFITEGKCLEFGARELKRIIQKQLTNPLANMVSNNQILSGDVINVFLENDQVVFDRWANELDLRAKMTE
jgi:ATP-dependent Clp protease ATP-binding subunit ClpB